MFKPQSLKGEVIYPACAKNEEISGFIFVHVPKTGGTSIRKALKKCGKIGPITHQSVAAYIEQRGSNIFDRFDGYGVIRNPLDRAVSSYYFGKKVMGNRGMPESRSIALNESNSFVEFCRNLKKYNNDSNSLMIMKTQCSYVCDARGDIPITLYPLERINELMSHLSKKFSLSVDRLSISNTSKHSHFIDEHTDETEEIIRELYSDDIGLYEHLMGSYIDNLTVDEDFFSCVAKK